MAHQIYFIVPPLRRKIGNLLIGKSSTILGKLFYLFGGPFNDCIYELHVRCLLDCLMITWPVLDTLQRKSGWTANISIHGERVKYSTTHPVLFPTSLVAKTPPSWTLPARSYSSVTPEWHRCNPCRTHSRYRFAQCNDPDRSVGGCVSFGDKKQMLFANYVHPIERTINQ
jgi:hypothetical protein